MRSSLRHHKLALFFTLLLAAGCQPAQTPSAVELRNLDERRALAVIERAVTDAGEPVTAGRTHTMHNGEVMREDLSLGGGPYGIAFLTENEAKQLASAVPPFTGQSANLRLVRPTDKATVLVLYEQNYRYDISPQHTITVVTAEKKLARDVSDFVHHIVKPAQQR